MQFDSHIHTELSTDSNMKLSEAIRTAGEKNLGLILTEHMDWEFPSPYPDFRVDLEAFRKAYGGVRSENLLLGIELGLTESSLEKNREILRENEFDFVLGSIHVLYGKEVYTELFREMDEKIVYRDYLAMCARLVSQQNIDSFAHIDYPLRYCQSELSYESYRAYFDAFFDVLVKQGICLELNTARLNRGENVYQNLLHIYSAYRARGGRYITIGSDAHTPEAIGRNFAVAQRLIEETGLIPVHFKNRRMVIE